MVGFIAIKKNIFDKIFSRRSFMVALCFECLIKNISIIKYGKYAIYIICVYAFLFLLYKVFFDSKFIFKRNMVLKYLFLMSAIIPCLIYKFIGLYNDIVLLVIFAVMFFIVSNFDDNENKKDLLEEFLFINRLICILYFIYSFISLIVALTMGTDRVYGLIDKVDYYSYNCVTAIGCSLYVFFVDRSKIYKFVSLLSVILHLFILFFTFARATYLGLFFAFGLAFMTYFKMNNNKIKKYLNIKTLLIFIILTIFFLLFSILVLPFDFDLLIEKVLRTGLSGRRELWEFGFNEFKKYNRLFGLSYGGLPVIWGKDVIMLKDTFSSDIISYNFFKFMVEGGMGHSVYFQQLFAHGIFGLIILIAFVFEMICNYFRLFIKINKQNKRLGAFIISCSFTIIAQLVIGFFNTNIFFNIVYISQIFFFYYAGMIKYKMNNSYND